MISIRRTYKLMVTLSCLRLIPKDWVYWHKIEEINIISTKLSNMVVKYSERGYEQ